MKKTLRLTLLAVAAAALLTSCDAMLESLFPDQTGQTKGTSNTITFNVKGYDQYPGNGTWNLPPYQSPATNGTGVVYVTITDANTGTISYQQHANFTASNPHTMTTTFYNIPDGTYNMEVWYDVDSDGTSNNEYNYSYWYYYTNYDDNYNSGVWVSGGTTATENFSLYEDPAS